MATIQIRDIPDEEYEALRAEGTSLQSSMREQTAFLARVARKRSVFERVRAELAERDESRVTAESAVADLNDSRGPCPATGTRRSVMDEVVAGRGPGAVLDSASLTPRERGAARPS